MKCMIIIFVFNYFNFEVLEMEPRSLRMTGKCFTPSITPLALATCFIFFFFYISNTNFILGWFGGLFLFLCLLSGKKYI